MKKMLLVLFLQIHFIILWPAYGKIIAVGIGPTQRDALTAAQRNAVEQGVGVLVDSQSLSENLMLIEDRIYAKARGYVKNYTVISEKKMNDGNWEVTIDSEVSQEQIKNNLEALGILREKMGNPRIMVIYDTKNTDDIFQDDNPVISEAYEGIIEYLTEREFPVLDSKTTEPGLKREAEYILVYNLKPGEQKPTGFFKKVWIMICAKIINTSSGQVIANQYKKVMGVDKESLDFAYRKAARKAGKLTAKFLEDKWVQIAQGKTVSGREVYLELVNIRSFSLLMEFKTQLRKAYGVRNVTQRNSTAAEVEYEITYVGDTDTLNENVNTILKEMGITAKTLITSGDRIRIEVTQASK
ncbi:MAG: hypothetical protein QG657_3767 [Acidobacteriota bacterium]|nr:hypothetical protein [Acidobacteriota bacterium]